MLLKVVVDPQWPMHHFVSLSFFIIILSLFGDRSSITVKDDTMIQGGPEAETNEDVEEYFIPDSESLAQSREKYCIQCLEILGEYVEVLGPVLHEKGVDVCLALLQRSSKHKEASKIAILLDVMKLICALAAHRKFAALFVDRGGMQKLLAVPRVAQTFLGLSSCLFSIGSLQVMDCQNVRSDCLKLFFFTSIFPVYHFYKICSLGSQFLINSFRE